MLVLKVFVVVLFIFLFDGVFGFEGALIIFMGNLCDSPFAFGAPVKFDQAVVFVGFGFGGFGGAVFEAITNIFAAVLKDIHRFKYID